jgi:hypothetical protein
MIIANYKLEWHGDAYKRRLLRELQRATRQGAERVRRNAIREQLNTSGKSATSKAGLNKGSAGDRWRRKSRIKGLRTVKTRFGRRKVMTFGGSYTYQDRKTKVNTTVDRIYWYGEPLHRWVQSSVPGTPPHKQTGTLQRSIAVEPAPHGLKAKVGPGQGLKYARIQELGGKGLLNLPPRPYMRPALAAEAQRIFMDYQMAIARASQ